MLTRSSHNNSARASRKTLVVSTKLNQQVETDCKKQDDTSSQPPTTCRRDKNGKLSRLKSLKAQIERGICLRPLTKAAVEICQKFNVSLACAYRHLHRGTTPQIERRLGRDGKWRPAKTGRAMPPVSAVMRELNLARQALIRADKKACDTEGINDEDVLALLKIISTAQEIIVRWEDARK
jgi:hypothetical protein